MRRSAHLRLYKGIPAPTSNAQLNAEGTALAGSASDPGGSLQLLIIEENARFAVTLRTTLETEGFVVAVAATVPQARQQMLDTPPAFVIIDTMAPSHDSYELLRTLRASGNDIPVIVLTTHGDEHDKLRGFWLGADDCITKPVNPLGWYFLTPIEVVTIGEGGRSPRPPAASVPSLSSGAASSGSDGERRRSRPPPIWRRSAGHARPTAIRQVEIRRGRPSPR